MISAVPASVQYTLQPDFSFCYICKTVSQIVLSDLSASEVFIIPRNRSFQNAEGVKRHIAKKSAELRANKLHKCTQ